MPKKRKITIRKLEPVKFRKMKAPKGTPAKTLARKKAIKKKTNA